MFKKIVCYLLIIPVLSLTSGCASYRFGRLPSPYIIDHPEAITQEGVSVAVEFLNQDKALTTFDCEMLKRRIQPVFVVIENKGSVPYAFRKADVEAKYIPAEEAAKTCSRSTMSRVLSYGVLGLVVIAWIVFIPMMIAEWINCPKINTRIRSDYIDSEIPDSTIGVGRSISGVIFVPPFSSDDRFIIPLVNRDTGEKLLFKFRDYSAPLKVEDKSESEEAGERPLEEAPKSNISF